MSSLAIEVDRLCKSFDGVVAVDRLSFHVHPGEVFGLLGPNGAGKTTTIRLLLDLIRPDAGTVRLLGQAPQRSRDRVGYLPQERGLYFEMGVEECLTYFGELQGLSRAGSRQRVRKLLDRVELSGVARKRVGELSRGMAQKVQILAALLHEPDLLILDEPFQSLDPISVVLVRDLMRDFQAAGKTVVLSAHDMGQVEAVCDRLLLVDHGRVVLFGSLASIKEQFSPNALHLWPAVDLEGWPGVLRAEVQGRSQTVYLAPDVVPATLLRGLLDRGWMPERFEKVEWPLEQIFVTAIRGRADT